MNSKKLFSKFLAKSLLVSAVGSCFSCCISAMETQDDAILGDIRRAVRKIIDDSVTRRFSLENKQAMIPMSPTSIHSLPFIDVLTIKSKVLRLLKSNTGRKYTNPDAAILRLNQKDALDLLGKIAKECQDQLKQNSAK